MAKLYLLLVVLLSTLTASELRAGITLGIAGSQSKSHLGLQELSTVSGKGSISVDLGSYIRLGYAYSQAFQHQEGYENKAAEDEPKELVYREQDIRQTAHTVNLFVVLFAGEIFTPYIFGGMAMKYYVIDTKEEGKDPVRETGSGPSPNGGAGLSIALNKNFSMKFTYTLSMASKEDYYGKKTAATDTQFDVGLSYKIN